MFPGKRKAVLIFILTLTLKDQIFPTEAQLMCSKVPSTSPCSTGLGNQRPSYYLPQTLPFGFVVNDALITLVQTYSGSADIAPQCTQVVKGLLCAALYAPCDNKTGLPLKMCPASCQQIRSIFNGSQCQYAKRLLEQTSNTPEELNGVFNNINCSAPETYFFGNASAGFSNATCYNVADSVPEVSIANGLDLILKISVSISGALLISLLVMVIMICFLVRANKRRRKVRKTTPVRTEQRSDISLIQNKRPPISEDFKDILQSSLITYAHLECEKVPIGEGAFGKVYKGLLIVPGHTAEQVAIKTIKNTLSDEDIRSFFSESAVMATFNHPNVLGLYGVCFDSPDGIPLMVLPYMVNGSLKSYLVKSRNHQSGKCDIYPDGLGFAVMIKMCTDIARGMSYLTDKRFVHRDLAARNCLLDHDLSVKIGDFGLSRDVYMTDYYRASSRGPLPVKWMPPEMLRDVISNEKTDVWAYGVTCWEVFSLGATPYPGVDNHQVLEHLTNGFRPAKPALCTDEIYGLLRRCWSERPEERPCFSEILIEIDALTGAHYYI